MSREYVEKLLSQPRLEFDRMLADVQRGPQIRPRPTMEMYRRTAADELRRVHRRKQIARCKARFCCFPLDQLRGLPLATTNTAASGVYFMWLGPELVYIGKSVQIGYRLFQHLQAVPRKPFTHTTFMAADADLIRSFEADLVKHYKPPFNFTSTG